jgi:hypothetical protein
MRGIPYSGQISRLRSTGCSLTRIRRDEAWSTLHLELRRIRDYINKYLKILAHLIHLTLADAVYINYSVRASASLEL